MRRRPALVLVAVLAAAAAALAVGPPPPVAAQGEPAAPGFESSPTITALPFLSVRLGVDPAGPQDFTFTGCQGTDGTACGSFTLDDDDDPTATSARTADGLTPGVYVITQAPVPHWTVTAISCTNTTTEVVDLAARRVTVDLKAGQGVFCTFSNRTQTIRIEQDTSPDDPTDFAFTGCQGPTACGGFTLDDDTDGAHRSQQVASVLAPGTYTVTQSGDGRWPLTALTCDHPESISLAARRVTIDLAASETVTCTFTNRTQSITIEQDTQPDGGQDVAFLGCMGSACGPITLDDDGDAALPRTTTARGLAPGTYTVTQDDVPGHDLREIECNTEESVDLAHRRVTITVGPLEDVWCTFRDRLRLAGATQVSAGFQRSCAVVTGGQVRCWGTGALGDGRDSGSTTPVVVSNGEGTGPLTGVVQVAAGAVFSCAVLDSGEARCWGVNHQGQLGNGTTADALRPTPVLNPQGTGPLTGVAEITTGFATACARLTNGEVRCWGYADDGMLGDATSGSHAVRPIVVLDGSGTGPLTGVTSVAAGVRHVCAGLDTGQARCWGRGSYGELGHGQWTDAPLPVTVTNEDGTAPLRGVSRVEAGWWHTCALVAPDGVRCWGVGEGLGMQANSNRPVTILDRAGGTPVAGIRSVTAGEHASCATTGDDEGRCWGLNYYGAIGDGTTTDRAFPVPVLDPTGTTPLTDIVDVSAGGDHACALLVSGEVRCWGANSGQLGDGTTTPHRLPVSVVSP